MRAVVRGCVYRRDYLGRVAIHDRDLVRELYRAGEGGCGQLGDQERNVLGLCWRCRLSARKLSCCPQG